MTLRFHVRRLAEASDERRPTRRDQVRAVVEAVAAPVIGRAATAGAYESPFQSNLDPQMISTENRDRAGRG